MLSLEAPLEQLTPFPIQKKLEIIGEVSFLLFFQNLFLIVSALLMNELYLLLNYLIKLGNIILLEQSLHVKNVRYFYLINFLSLRALHMISTTLEYIDT